MIGAHPDDVEVSTGGTIQTLVADGWDVEVNVQGPSIERWNEHSRAVKILGARSSARPVGEPRHEVSWIERLAIWPPDLIVTTSSTDTHPDHRAAAELGLSLVRKNNITLWEMNHAIPGGIYGAPQLNHFVVFSGEQANMKRDALKAHKSQFEKYGYWWLDTVMARDRYYGLLADRETYLYAEGFRIVHSR